MADKFISYGSPMIRALLEDRKTKTRRLFAAESIHIWTGGLDHPGRYIKPDAETFVAATNNARDFRVIEGRLSWVTDPAPHQRSAVMAQWHGRPRITVKDRLWVKETWLVDREHDHLKPSELPEEVRPIWYESGYVINSGNEPFFSKKNGADFDAIHVRGRHRNSRFMPRRLSRLTLIVTDLRVERLHDITDEDAFAEGVAPHPSGIGFWVPGLEHPDPNFPSLSRPTPSEMYAALWDTIHGSGKWGENPLVTVYTFTVLKENIERIAA